MTFRPCKWCGRTPIIETQKFESIDGKTLNYFRAFHTCEFVRIRTPWFEEERHARVCWNHDYIEDKDEKM